MKKLMLLLTLSLSYLAVAGALTAQGNPPSCDPCPWVR
jgi:hypothetical protein